MGRPTVGIDDFARRPEVLADGDETGRTAIAMADNTSGAAR